MKLYEIFGPEDISMGSRPVKAGQFKNPKTREVGEGQYAKAFDHPTRPGSVIKIVRDIRVPDADAQVVFSDISMKHQDNPFFPRIYQAKVIEEDDGKNVLVVEMEKLHPITRSNIRHMIPHIFKQIGVHEEGIKDIIKTGIPTKDFKNQSDFDKANWEFFKIVGTYSALQRMSEFSKNPKFTEAIEIMDDWMSLFNYDLHAKNWMFRLTPHGPQLVMLDPFASA